MNKYHQYLDEQAIDEKHYPDIDPTTGNISEYHRNNCNGCALCECDDFPDMTEEINLTWPETFEPSWRQ